MKKLLALASVVALATACAGAASTGGGDTELTSPGAVGAADLGYHGPLHRTRILYGN
jgi:hypothetical protein